MRYALPVVAVVFALSLSMGIFSERAFAPLVQAVDPSGGGGIEGGLERIRDNVDIPVGNGQNLRETIIDIINFALSFLALAAVIMIIIAGFFLVLGGGSEASATRAKKIILYTIIGLVIIFFARVIVGFFTVELPSFF